MSKCAVIHGIGTAVIWPWSSAIANYSHAVIQYNLTIVNVYIAFIQQIYKQEINIE